jgi:hypothetical protein
MTGVQKFGRKSHGAAQYFLVTPWTGNPADIHDAFRDSGYVKKISKQVVPEARFKSNSVKKKKVKTGFYSIYSVVGLGLKNMTEELEELNKELLTEATLLDRIKDIVSKFKNWLIKMWAKAKQWIGNNWQRLIDFLALEPLLYFNNRPRW